MSSNPCYGAAARAHNMPPLTSTRTTPTQSSGSKETMKDLGFGEEYDEALPPIELVQLAGFLDEDNDEFKDIFLENINQQYAVFHDDNHQVIIINNNGSAYSPAVPSSAESVIYQGTEFGSSNSSIHATRVGISAPSSARSVTYQGSEFDSSNSSLHVNRIGTSGTDGRNDMNNLGDRGWDSGPIGNFGPGLQSGHPDQFRPMSHLTEQATALPLQYLDPELLKDQEAGMGPYYTQRDPQHAGSQQVNQQLVWDEYPMLQPRRRILPPTVNGFGGLVLNEQSRVAAANQNTFVDLNVAVDPHTAINPNAAIDLNHNGAVGLNHNGEFIPLFFDEKAFEERKRAQQADRKKSDYPYNDINAQHKIIGCLYEAIRNTTEVEDSDKVAAKFADDSIPEEEIHRTCWEVMIACRESQECGPLVANYHGTKHLVKDTFSARIESAIATLRKSKAACKQVLGPSFVNRLADQPDEELKRKICNKELNRKKTGQNKAGQAAIALECADKNGVWKGPRAGTRAEPQPAGPSSGALHRLEYEAEDAPASKRARRREPRSGSSSGTA